MSRTVKKTCPITSSDEITITYPDPNELVMTQRKDSNGSYKRVLRPRKEVKNATLPRFSCPSLKHPLVANLPESLSTQLLRDEKSWCAKIGKPCVMDEKL
ncbi:hypothetical protein KAU88_07145 [Candidatus Bathyarchaeota archaeon]|nr:hypothetical protein [Candidatus Bathyarchaeota archaeon]